jgi:glycerophosphoryl diester phosphodiesterase
VSYLRPGKFDLIAHRGGGLEAPENTLEAFANAHRLYNDAVFELDVHRTRDGEIVCIHDDTVDRTTDGHGFVWDKTIADLQRLDAGYRFTLDGGRTFPFRGKKVVIPRLGEVLERFPQSRVSIEIKHSNPFFGKDIVDLVEKLGAQDRVVLAGSNHKILLEACGHGRGFCSGYSSREVLSTLIAGWTFLAFLAPDRGDVYQVPLEKNHIKIISPHFVEQAHGRGKFVHVWTINDEATMRHLIKIGVDGIVTDAPSLLLRVARELQKI